MSLVVGTCYVVEKRLESAKKECKWCVRQFDNLGVPLGAVERLVSQKTRLRTLQSDKKVKLLAAFFVKFVFITGFR